MSDWRGVSRERAWAVAKTLPNKEHIAIAHLERQRFDIYCPMIRKSRRHARRIEQVLRPLFPSYLFVHLDLEREKWRPILSTVGVSTLVHFGNQLGLLDDDFIESLRSREQDGEIVRPANPYKVGQQVRLIGGPFDGVVAAILSVDERDRLLVLMDLLQRSVKVRVGLDRVYAA